MEEDERYLQEVKFLRREIEQLHKLMEVQTNITMAFVEHYLKHNKNQQ